MPPANNAINAEINRGVNALVNIGIGQILNQAANQAHAGTGKQLAIFAAAYNSAVRRSRGARIKKIHTQAAIRAQSAIMTAYRGRNRRNPVDPYRDSAPGKWKRDSNGAMERGLASPEFFKATGTQLAFINKNSMDRAARQWYRLNFGAGPAGAATPQPGVFQLQILGRDTGLGLTLAGNAVSAPYMMPAGIWRQRGAGQEFVPIGYLMDVGRTLGARNSKRSATKKRMSLGFPGYNYLDAGIDDLVAGLGAGYSVLAQEWFTEASLKNTGPVAFVISQKEAASILPAINRNIEALSRQGALQGFTRR